jgi:DNA-binding MarR family transcriptional regulator
MSSNHRARYREYVTFRLDLVSTRARMEADKVYERECGLGIRHLRVLRRVAERPGASVSEIVESTMFERTLVSRLISDLVGKALLERRISPVDARQFNIDITPEGLAKAEFADELGDELNEDLLSSLDANERIVFDRCLEKLVRWQPKGAEDARTAVPAPVGEEDFTPPDGVTMTAGNRRKSRK